MNTTLPTDDDYRFCADLIGADPAVIRGIAMAETDEIALVDGRAYVRFDPKYFTELTRDKSDHAKALLKLAIRNRRIVGKSYIPTLKEAQARAGDWYAIKNVYDKKRSRFKSPFTQGAQWEIIGLADTLDADASAKSARYGCFLMWGYLAQFAGHADTEWAATNFRDVMSSSVRAQMKAFATFVNSDVVPTLKAAILAGDPDRIAHHYRGAGSVTTGYAETLDIAIRKVRLGHSVGA